MASKEPLARDADSPASDLEDYELDTQYLIGYEQNRKKISSQQKRNWAFLAVNSFILLLNIGALLMMAVPKAVKMAGTGSKAPLPHEGEFEFTYLNLL